MHARRILTDMIAEMLACERALEALGFVCPRVYQYGELAVVQVSGVDSGVFSEPLMRTAVVSELRRFGFRQIAVDISSDQTFDAT